MTKEKLKEASDLLEEIEEIKEPDGSGILHDLKDKENYRILVISGRCDDGVCDWITEIPEDLRALVIGYYEDKLAKLEAEFENM